MALLSLILGLVGGALVGGAMILADRVGFYLIVLIPILGGTIIGFFVALPYLNRKNTAVQTSSLGGGLSEGQPYGDNRPSVGPLILAALLGTALAGGIYWGGSYILAHEDIVTEIQAEEPTVTREEIMEFVDQYYMTEYNATGFSGFVQDVAAAGISINRTGSSSSGFTLEGGIVYAYWVLEIVLIAGFAISTALRRARAEPEVAQVATAS